jgi:hypothetical protein
MRIRVVGPPAGVQWCLQRGASELTQPKLSTKGEDLTFDLELRAQPGPDGVRFLGPFTQGPPKARFVYLCAGTLAGQFGSCWTRRAKIGLTGITWEMVGEACDSGRLVLAEFQGVAKDGGPACATVKCRLSLEGTSVA